MKKSKLINPFTPKSDAITIDAKRLHFRCEQYCIILPSRNKSFSRNPFEFLHIQESLVFSILETRDSILETRSSNVSSIEARESSLEVRVLSVNLLLSGTVGDFILSNARRFYSSKGDPLGVKRLRFNKFSSMEVHFDQKD